MRRADGFTLLEMLIALAIFGLGTALLMQSAWSGAWSARQAWGETAALRLAQSVAAEVGVALPLDDRPRDVGLDGPGAGLPYRVKIVPGRLSATGDRDYRVEVREMKPDVTREKGTDAAPPGLATRAEGPVLATVTNRLLMDGTQ
ncbi:type II secretion system protein [Nitrospirillum sp. BR 11828]|uniref:type II secretion system protein n=1 Tax=Nitrospirillum sp. BR 11828 TaxID=3104325 RepID=UPI002ACAAE56|nr:prepilin-type N-terminal cleavage/methylation domain-containing protein [Nitrospirillum sp. BR 11828]MDZ5649531.1 prepilin-type N-terminal cleavage/methylation domain-containing protein [Nitrospirillum sp. BR 11828]